MKLVLGDITEMTTDAIVTGANSDLMPTPGINSAIFQAADTEALQAACRNIGRCRIGSAVATPSCGLPCRYIIHVAGAGWYGGRSHETHLFADCYRRALQRAYTCHCRSVALPLMFSGGSHLPREQALRIVCQVVRHFEALHPSLDITLVLYKPAIYRMAQRIWAETPGPLPAEHP